ncbi:MAG: metal-sensing transcriptional repressor [bacterium]|nr:metal-sensing transcriptional repressor [bacterium]
MPKGVPRDSSIKQSVLHRLKIARGHLDKVIQMTDSGDYCVDIIYQSRAVQKALKEADSVLLDNHLKTCVADQIRNGETTESLNEILKIFKNKE